jgi:acetyl-CoA/propionyl-CoA carboxylase carboxyl transferase subunit
MSVATKPEAPGAPEPSGPAARFDVLFDTWGPLGEEPMGGVEVARGLVDGRPVVAFCTDPKVKGGALGEEGCFEIERAYQAAKELGCPIVGIWHSGGARLAEGVLSLHGIGRIFHVMTRCSGVIPQISVVVGPAAGGAAYGPALTDVVILSPEARVFVTGPGVIASVTREDVSFEELGGPQVHSDDSGLAHFVEDDPDAALSRARQVATLLGSGPAAVVPVEDVDLRARLPEDSKVAYDVHPVVDELLDDGTMLDLQSRWAPNLVTALGRLGGIPVGVIANNPLRLGGCLESRSAEKAARFVRLCDAFGLPLLVLVDVPGYLPGKQQESLGVLRRGAKLLHAFSAAVVPRATVILHKAYGGAFIAMNARSLGAQAVFAWPGAEVAVMGAVAAVRVLHRKELATVEDPDEVEKLETELADRHLTETGGLDFAVGAGVVDRVIDPGHTRTVLFAWLAEAVQAGIERGNQRNIPL